MKINRKDTINFLSHLSIPRITNILKLVTSFYLTKLLRRPIVWGQPMTLSFEPTTACNLKCPECPSGLRSFTRETGNLKKNFFKDTIDQVSNKLLYLIFYFQGEPYINPDFLEMVEYANKQGLYTITSTNGHFLTEKNCKQTILSKLDRIIISIDGTTQESYQSYRIGGRLETVLEGTKRLVSLKKSMKSSTPHIIFQFLVVKPNEHQIDDLNKLADEIGVDEVKIKTAQVYNYENGNPLIPTIEKYSRYLKQPDGTYTVKHQLKNHCWKLWHAAVITWNGHVVPCCFDKDAKYKMGELGQSSFTEIWKSSEYNKFRKTLVKGRKYIDICKNCTEGCKVWA